MNNKITVAEFIKREKRWDRELDALRKIIKTTSLQEVIKWGIPVYTFEGKNLVGLAAFKSYTAIWFYQGSFLKDTGHKLINAQEKVTKGLRQWRFTSLDEIKSESETIKKYIEEAILNQKQGKSIKPDRNKPLIIPKDLEILLSENMKLKESYDQLTKSKQREYAEYVAEAKKEETRMKRLNKITPMILQGCGLNDKYKK